MRKGIGSCPVAALALLWAAAGNAAVENAAAEQSDAAQTGGIEEELLVVGQLEETTPLKLARYGNRVEVITAEEIRLGGFDDLTQVLQMRVPGLYLAPKNGAFDYMGCSLQGSRCEDILWLIDGVRINNRLYNTTSPLDTVPAHMVERIEVLYGGQGIFYGTQSVAGVVNVVTRPFSDATTGSVAASLDSNDGRHVNGEVRGAVGRHQLVVYGSVDEADGFQPFSDADYQPSGTDRDRGYDVKTLGAKYAVSLSDQARLSLLYQHTDNRVEWAYPAVTERSYNDREEDLLTAKIDLRVTDNVDVYVKGYYHDWDSHWTERDNVLDGSGNLTGEVDVVSDAEYWGYEDYGLTAVADVRTGRGVDLSLGYDHQRYSGRDEVLLIEDRTEKVNALFAQLRTDDTLFERTSLAVGVRYNRPGGDGDITVWNVSGKHDFSGALYLRGTAGTAFRFPDAWQLYGNDPCCTLGNPDLKGERSRNLNLSLGGRLDWLAGFDWEVIGFLREVKDLIGSENGARVNTDAAVDFDGFELVGTLALSGSWRLVGAYTHTRAEAEGSSEQIVDVPEDLLKATLEFVPGDGPFEVSASLVWVGNLYDEVPGIGRVEHGDYTVVDLGAAWYLGAARRHRLGLRLENAFDEDYGSSLGRAFRDTDGSSYAYTNLGTPRTLHVSYRFGF